MALLFISKNPLLKENIDKNTHKPKQNQQQSNKQKYFNTVNFITGNNTYQDPF